MFKNCLNILRDNEHLTGDKALRNLAYFLVLRLIEPKIDEMGMMDYDYPFDEYDEEDREKIMSCLKFSELISNKEENYLFLLKPLWECVLTEHPKTKDIFSKDNFFNIKNQSTFKKIFKKLSDFDFSNIEADIQGEAYEEVIKDVMTGKTLGQFFTPPLIKKFIVNRIKPKVLPNGITETVFDPAMGTGGFLITALRYFLKESKEKSIPLDWNFISNEGLGGREPEPDTYQLARSNMLISSGYMFNVLEIGDTIRNPIQNKYDIVMTNPPFGIKGLNYSEITSELRNEYLPIKTNSAVPLFLQAIIYMLKINGRCGVVLPDGKELFGKQKMLVSVREYLMKTCDLKEVVYIPGGVFTHTSIKTCVFFFEKKKEGTDVLQTKVSYSKKNPDKETRRSYKFIKEHTTEKVDFTQFNINTRETKFLISVPIEKMAQNGYSLNYSEYLEVENVKFNFDDIEVKTLGEIFDDISTKKNIPSSKRINGKYRFFTCSNKYSTHNEYYYEGSYLIHGSRGTIKGSVFHTNNEKFSIGTSMFISEMKKDTNCELKYIYYHLKYKSNILDKYINGTAIPMINKNNFYNIKIPIPPLKLQKNIVEQLDFICEQCIVKSENKIQQLKKLNEMYLKNRIQFENNEKTLGEVCDEIKIGKDVVKKNRVKGIYPFYGANGIIDYVNEFLFDGKFILTARTGSIGSLHITNDKFWCSGDVHRLKINNFTTLKYVFYYLKTIDFQKYRTGVAHPKLSSSNLKSINILTPPLQVQKEIVDYCDNNNNLIENLEQEIERNKDLADKIINSFCQKVEVREDNIENSDKKISSKKKIILKTSDKNCECFE
jgi:type I restriction-modification system DNA methylase subunit